MEQPLPIVREYFTEVNMFCEDNQVTIINRSHRLREMVGIRKRYQLWADYDDLIVCVMFKDKYKKVKSVKCHDQENNQNHVEIVLGDELTIDLLAEELAHKLPIYASRIRDAIAAEVPTMILKPIPGERAF